MESAFPDGWSEAQVDAQRSLWTLLDSHLPGALQEGLLLPASRRDVATVLSLAHRSRALIRVPGSTTPVLPGVPTLDLRRMNALLKFDDQSRIAHVQAGMRVHTLEDELRRRGLSLGAHSIARDFTVGEWLARGARGARDLDDDPVDQVISGAEWVLPDGQEVHVRPAPRRAVGPDLLSALIGARGRLGVIVGVHVCARRRVQSESIGYLFPTRDGASAALAWVRGRGVRPLRAYIQMTAEGSALRLKMPALDGPDAIDSTDELARAWRDVVSEVAKEFGGVKIAKRDLPNAKPREAPPESAIVDALSRRLDARAVLRLGDRANPQDAPG